MVSVMKWVILTLMSSFVSITKGVKSMSKLTKKVTSLMVAFMLALTMVCGYGVGDVKAATTSSVLRAWNGTFEKSLSKTTGWGTIDLNFYKADSRGRKLSSKYGTIPHGNNDRHGSVGKFLLLGGVSGDYLKVKYNGKVGYVNKYYTLINLPDVLPSIKYNITNAHASIYKCTGKNIAEVTGRKLYETSKVQNKKINRKEYIVPILYTSAIKIAKAQKAALGRGYCLKIYDAYRPHWVTSYVYGKFSNFLNKNRGVYGQAFSSQYGQGWFLAQNISSHNVGSAIDVTMVNYSSGAELKMPTAMHELSKRAVKYANSGTKNSKSGYAKSMTSAAKIMNSIFIDAGMTTLASEWWHFQDQSGYETNRSNADSMSCWYPQSLAY